MSERAKNECELRVLLRLRNRLRASFNLVEVQCRGGHQQHDAKRDDAIGQVQHWDLSGWFSPDRFFFFNVENCSMYLHVSFSPVEEGKTILCRCLLQ